jgi:hypothetical protein
MARDYGERHGISAEWIERAIGLTAVNWGPTLDHGAVVAAILAGLVVPAPTEDDAEYRVRQVGEDGETFGAWKFGDGEEQANRRQVERGRKDGFDLRLQRRLVPPATDWEDVVPVERGEADRG